MGNACFGGAGKTTLTIYLAKKLKASGMKVVVLSRGYRGLLESKGGEVSLDVDEPWRLYGDEPCLIKEEAGVPVFVGKNRVSSGLFAFDKYRPDVAILDDGMQYLSLKKDIEILILRGDEERAVFLREPPEVLFGVSDIVMVRRGKDISFPPEKGFFFRIEPEGIYPEDGIPKRPFVFSGLGNNRSFLDMLKAFGIEPLRFASFRDHMDYRKVWSFLVKRAIALGADSFITTEKDWVKVKNFDSPIPVLRLKIRLIVEDEVRFLNRIFYLLDRDARNL